ncbi:hypothetical protein U0070_017341 [Myodes glareolus]|uniref:Uncharacterized protein n=1 Tax=Myodes glareolus TaxID=447135 RepID=A0AAW0K245_MYOGA
MATGAGPSPRPGFQGLLGFHEVGPRAEKLTRRWVSGDGGVPRGCALAISERWLPQPKAFRSSVYSTFATLGHRHEDSEASSPSTPDAGC